jgi:tight adherence protein B
MSAAGPASLFAALAASLAVVGAAWALHVPMGLPSRFGNLADVVILRLGATGSFVRSLASPAVPLTATRRGQLRLVASFAALVAGSALFGVRLGLLLGPTAAWAAPRVVSARRARHGRRVEEGAPAAALALADALSAGASARGCVAVAAARLDGPIADELRRTAWELDVGAATDAALDRLRGRSVSRGVGLIVAAMQVQRRCGGDLVHVLRGVAAALEDDRRTRQEARAATAQARFTALVVMGLPVCGVALGAVASPGLPGRMIASPAGVVLLFAALGFQAAGMLAIRRLARTLE